MDNGESTETSNTTPLKETVQDKREAVERKRKDQGLHECEVFGCGPEALESAYAWEHCQKNPGHPTFIPVSEFSVRCLPEEYQTDKVFAYISNIAARTARLRVGYTSRDRPDGYIFSNCRGSDVTHTGSGLVTSVRPGFGECHCPECGSRGKNGNNNNGNSCSRGSRNGSNSGSSKWSQKVWWVHVLTACHVVYDTQEAAATTVDLFYDDASSEVEGRVRTMYGTEMLLRKDEAEDWCYLVCTTHDAGLARQLSASASAQNVDELVGVFAKGDTKDERRDLCVVVSHPHGQPKKVTVGRRREWQSAQTGLSSYSSMYDTDTCPGSSGAPVIVPSKNFSPCSHLWAWNLPHSSGLLGGLNMSGVGNGWLG